MARLKRCLRALGGDKRGGVAIMVGLVMVALVAMLALAADVSAAVSAHARLREAANAAALATVRQAAIDTAANSAADLTHAAQAGCARFYAQASTIPGVGLNQANGCTTTPTNTPSTPVEVTVQRNGLTITSNVIFNATYSTQIANFLGKISPHFTSVASLPLGGAIGAQQQVGAYVDITVLMDVSNSMTIAASDTDASNLANATTWVPMWYNSSGYGWQGCTFGCHANLSSGYKVAPYWDYNYTMPGNVTDYYTLAQYFGISMRIDIVKKAVNNIISAMKNATDPSKFRFGFYTFDNDSYQVYSLGSPASVGSTVTNTQVNPVSYCCTDYQTNVDQSVTDFSSAVLQNGLSGDGSSQAQSKKFVLIITDGINDNYSANGNAGRDTTPMDPTKCQAMKNAGIGVFVLQAANPSQFPVNGSDFSSSQAAFDASVANMKACASPGLYFLASNSNDIQTATQTIINLALSQATVLTQGSATVTSGGNTGGNGNGHGNNGGDDD